jgi:hypothetical protein
VKHGKWRIAIVGVLDPKGTAETLGPGLVIERMETALGSLLPQLKGQLTSLYCSLSPTRSQCTPSRVNSTNSM